jgi:signal transduction histidine kinase
VCPYKERGIRSIYRQGSENKTVMGKSNCSVEELRSLEPLNGVPDDQLQWLLDAGECREAAEGDVLIDVGDKLLSTCFFLDGRYIDYFQQGNQLNEVKTLERGHIMGYLPFSRAAKSIIRVVCVTPGKLLVVPADKIAQVTKLYHELTAALVHFMISRIRFATQQQQQIEKTFALGKLSAGLAHELNNPSAAIMRNASILAALFVDIPELFAGSASMPLDAAQTASVREILKTVLSREQKEPLSMMETANKEDFLDSWLTDHGLDDLPMADILVSAGFTVEDLETTIAGLATVQAAALLRWLSYHLTAGRIAKEIEAASRKISTLIGAVKTFSHMDRGNDKEWIDVHTGIESTLTLLDHKLRKQGVIVVREYASDLPRILAWPGELNQVWTNLFDNAIDAMSANGRGTLTITTGKDRSSVIVITQDDGPGISVDILPRIFDPFFTTKDVGKGTGLGLEIVSGIIQQHSGSIKVDSAAGRTCFHVSLPMTPTQ